MRRGDVDIVLVGADRVAANGDVCNKIGTYDKALAARDNGVPFYVALPVADARSRARVRRRDPDRGARARRSARRHRPRQLRSDDDGRASRPRARARSTMRSTSRRRGSSPGSSPSAESPRPIATRSPRCFRSVSGEWRARGRTRAARSRDRDRARDERARHQSRQVGQRERALAHAKPSTATSSRRPGMPYADIAPDDIVALPLDGDAEAARGARLPSSEWRFHRDIYRARRRRRRRSSTRTRRSRPRSPASRAASPRSTTWSRSPAASDIRCAPYATFGTQALSDHAVAALDGRTRVPARESRDDRRRRVAARRRWRSPSRSRRSPRCTGARCRSASRRCCPTPRWTSSSPSSAPTASRGA